MKSDFKIASFISWTSHTATMQKYLLRGSETKLKRTFCRALHTRITVKAIFKIYLPIAVALFILTLAFPFYLNGKICAAILKIDKAPVARKAVLNATVRLPTLCLNESCRLDYERHLHKVKEFPVPAIRHIVWKSELVSEYFADQLRSWQRIHPDWTFVLWRDQDLEPFVGTHFPGLLAKFKSLPDHIMRVDMVRYMILYKYGGVYADLDYRLVRNLDTYRRFHALITREPEMHAMEFLGVSWPPPLMPSPAFMLSAPGHEFFYFALRNLGCRRIIGILHYAGPLALAEILQEYQNQLPIATNAMETVYVPPSFAFYSYPENRFNNSKGPSLQFRFDSLKRECKLLLESQISKWQLLKKNPQLHKYCANMNNLDPITDKSHAVFAIHDVDKPGPAYEPWGVKFFSANLTDARQAIGNLKLGGELLSNEWRNSFL